MQVVAKMRRVGPGVTYCRALPSWGRIGTERRISDRMKETPQRQPACPNRVNRGAGNSTNAMRRSRQSRTPLSWCAAVAGSASSLSAIRAKARARFCEWRPSAPRRSHSLSFMPVATAWRPICRSPSPSNFSATSRMPMKRSWAQLVGRRAPIPNRCACPTARRSGGAPRSTPWPGPVFASRPNAFRR